MIRLHQLITALIAATLLLSACGGQSTAENAPEPTTEPAAATESETAEGTNEESEAVAETNEDTDGSAATADVTGYPRTITDGAGREIMLDAPPERVVALFNGNFGTLATLDVLPVGTLANQEMLDDSIYFADSSSIESVEGEDGYSAELIAALEPDLIMALRQEQVDELNAIAPVYLSGPTGSLDETIAELRRASTLFGLEDKAEEIISTFNQRVDAYAASSEENADLTFMKLAVLGDGQLSVATSNDPVCDMLNMIVTCTWDDPTGGEGWGYDTTIEGVLDLNPDIIILNSWADDVESARFEVQEDPLFAELTAVQNDMVFSTPGYENPIASNLPAAQKVLDTYVPQFFSDTFDGPLTDEEVQEIMGSEADAAEESSTAASAEDFPVTVTDAHGHGVTLDAPPNNMICLVVHCSWTLAFIGETPEATLDYDGFNDIFDHPNYFDYFDEVTNVDVTFIPAGEDAPDYEEILAFEPDFVWVNDNDQYVALSEFVPAYQQSFEVDPVDAFFEDARNAARIFGKEGVAEANIEALLQRAEAYATASDQTLSMYYGFPADEEGSSFVIQEGGIICLVVPEAQCGETTEEKWEEYSMEGLLELDPGVLIIEDVQGDRAEIVETLNQNPLWQELSAFKNDRIFVLNRLTTAPRPTNPLSFRIWLDGVMPLAYPNVFDGPLTDEQVQEIVAEQ